MTDIRQLDKIFATNPIIDACLKKCGKSYDDIPWAIDHNNGDLEKNYNDDHGFILMLDHDGWGRLSWRRPEGLVRYNIDQNGDYQVITLVDKPLPQTVMSNMTGQLLCNYVDIPGSDKMQIICAVNSKAFVSDTLDARIEIKTID